MLQYKDMQYKNFGNTGLMVSALAFGNAANTEIPHDENVQIVKKCLELGINYFDTAELYWDGEGEVSLGKIFKELGVERQSIVVATKVWVAPNPSLNSNKSTNRKHIKESLNGSLSRLQMDYVDILYVHSYDEDTSVQETCRSINELIQEGKAFYWAISNWDADRVFEAFRVCEQLNLHRPVAAQLQYNMIVRKQVQSEYRKLFEDYKFGLVAYNILLGGYLTGKYLFEKGEGRFTQEVTGKYPKEAWKQLYHSPHDMEAVNQKMKDLKQLAEKQLNCSLVHLVIAWTLNCPYMTSTLLGARNPNQLEDSVKALQIAKKLSPQIEAKVNKILNTHPDPRFDPKKFSLCPHVRPISSD